MQLGTYFEGKVCSWSEAVSFPSSSREVPVNDADESLSVPVAFVLGSGEIRGARWSVTSRMFRGIEIISIEQRFQVINNVGRPLLAHPVLMMSGKKVINNSIVSCSLDTHQPSEYFHRIRELVTDEFTRSFSYTFLSIRKFFVLNTYCDFGYSFTF